MRRKKGIHKKGICKGNVREEVSYMKGDVGALLDQEQVWSEPWRPPPQTNTPNEADHNTPAARQHAALHRWQ